MYALGHVSLLPVLLELGNIPLKEPQLFMRGHYTIEGREGGTGAP